MQATILPLPAFRLANDLLHIFGRIKKRWTYCDDGRGGVGSLSHFGSVWWPKNLHLQVVVSNIFYFHLYLGKIPILTSIFFKWVGSTTNYIVIFPEKRTPRHSQVSDYDPKRHPEKSLRPGWPQKNQPKNPWQIFCDLCWYFKSIRFFVKPFVGEKAHVLVAILLAKKYMEASDLKKTPPFFESRQFFAACQAGESEGLAFFTNRPAVSGFFGAPFSKFPQTFPQVGSEAVVPTCRELGHHGR